MGEVYEVTEEATGRHLALKLIGEGALPSATDVERFKRERESLGAVNHPNVLRVHAAGSWRGRPYLLTELLTGGDLASLLDRGGLDRERALVLFEQVVAGVAALHAAGITHRDIKPSNLLLTEDDRVKVADLGLAVENDSGRLEALTQTHAMIGTPAYMSPEALRGKRIREASTDVYALGILGYEMLTGKIPHQAEHFASFMVQRSRSGPCDPRSEDPSIEAHVADAIRQATHPDLAQRYPDARALLRGLRATPPAPTPVTTVVVVLAVAAMGLGLALQVGDGSSRSSLPQQTSGPTAADTTPPEWLRELDGERVSLTLRDGARAAGLICELQETAAGLELLPSAVQIADESGLRRYTREMPDVPRPWHDLLATPLELRFRRGRLHSVTSGVEPSPVRRKADELADCFRPTALREAFGQLLQLEASSAPRLLPDRRTADADGPYGAVALRSDGWFALRREGRDAAEVATRLAGVRAPYALILGVDTPLAFAAPFGLPLGPLLPGAPYLVLERERHWTSIAWEAGEAWVPSKSIRSSPQQPWLGVVTAPRGDPLAVHPEAGPSPPLGWLPHGRVIVLRGQLTPAFELQEGGGYVSVAKPWGAWCELTWGSRIAYVRSSVPEVSGDPAVPNHYRINLYLAQAGREPNAPYVRGNVPEGPRSMR